MEIHLSKVFWRMKEVLGSLALARVAVEAKKRSIKRCFCVRRYESVQA